MFGENAFDSYGDSFDSDGTFEGSFANGTHVFSNMPITPAPQTKTDGTPRKLRNPLVAMAAEFSERRIWSVQHWSRSNDDAPASLWPSHVYNGMTYSQAQAKQAELMMGVDPELNSVEIVIKMGM